MKQQHAGFPSDIFVTLVACNASLTVGDAKTGAAERFPVSQLLQHKLDGKLILSCALPKQAEDTYVRNIINWDKLQ